MTDSDRTIELAGRVAEAAARRSALEIIGGGSKRFYGREPRGEPLRVGDHCGIVSYEPTELVLRARAGTPLREIEATLAGERQMLAFEPPGFDGAATLGGTVASGLSGPRRPWAGALRDHVLGVSLLNGAGQRMTFGGQVMKNVAGFDVSRLMAGALGTLGLLLDVALKVLPQPECEITLEREATEDAGLALFVDWWRRGLPLSATTLLAGRACWRLSGSAAAVASARRIAAGEVVSDGHAYWRQVRDQSLTFFSGDEPLWRVSLPVGVPPLRGAGTQLCEWAGALRWLRTRAPAPSLRDEIRACGGHLTAFRHGDRSGEVFAFGTELDRTLHRRLKAVFDAGGVLNPGRLHGDL